VQGKVGFWISGQWILKKLRANPAVHYVPMLMPGVTTGTPGISFAGGEYLAVTAASQHKQLAREFVQWMTDGTNAVRFCRAIDEAGFPADARFFDDSTLVADPDRAVFAQQLQHARMTPVHPQWLDVEAQLERKVEEALLGQ
jgi:ABC-type glycerol-3-phosphate transport system substrate-binding protein